MTIFKWHLRFLFVCGLLIDLFTAVRMFSPSLNGNRLYEMMWIFQFITLLSSEFMGGCWFFYEVSVSSACKCFTCL